jgi:hypothetical protein
MKTWQKITIILVTLVLIGSLIFLYFYGQSNTGTGDPDGTQDPIFPFEPPSGSDGDDFFSNDDDDPSAGDDDVDDDQEVRDRLWLVSDRPVAGSQWITREDGSEVIWYIQKENGHAYEHDTEERESVRLTNTTIPRVQEAFISQNGNYIIYRYIDIDTRNIKTYLATVSETPNGETSHSIDGSLLPDNLSEINLSPDGEQVFSLQNTANGVIGVLYNIISQQGEVIFNSPLQEWHTEWNSENTITIFTKPAANVEGVAYQINTTDRSKRKLTNGTALTTSVHPDNSYLLAGTQESGSYRSRLYEVNNLQTSVLSPATLVDKCGWGQDKLFCGVPNNLPDKPLKDWYQGKINFSDQLVSFMLPTRNQINIFTNNELNKGPFDVISLNTAQNSNHLIFKNKINDDLWALNLENN